MDMPTCPVCGTALRRYGRGATARKHGERYACPVTWNDTPIAELRRRREQDDYSDAERKHLVSTGDGLPFVAVAIFDADALAVAP